MAVSTGNLKKRRNTLLLLKAGTPLQWTIYLTRR